MAAKKRIFGWMLFVTWLLCAAPLTGQAKQAHETDPVPGQGDTAHDHGKPREADESAIGVDEKIGSRIPPDIELTDVNGRTVLLDDVLDKPTLLMLVFYKCPSACSMIQSNAAHAVNNAPHQPGKEFKMVTVSFDDEDTPENARQARTDFTKILKDREHAQSWSFFTADANNIKRLTDAVGFTFMKMGPHNFVHPNLVTMVSGSGKVIRYLYGTDFLPFDIGMAVTEALREEPGISIKKIVSYCFDYDPERKRYAFKIVRVFGAFTLAGLALLFALLLRKKN